MHSEHGFLAAVDWLLSGQAGKFGQQLGALALECNDEQLMSLLNTFRVEFDRAAKLSELYEWAEIPFNKSIARHRSISTNELI